jgi:nucleobase transporter 1/2
MKFFSYAGKFGAVIASIPAPIVAALYCLFFSYVGMYNQLKQSGFH